MKNTCCPLYTIKQVSLCNTIKINVISNKISFSFKRCDAVNIELTKSQKNVLKIVKNYLEKNVKPKERDKLLNKAESLNETTTAKASTVKSDSKHKEKKQQINNTNISINSSNENAAQKVINYYIENQNNENINEPNFKLKSKHKRLFKKCLKVGFKNKNQKVITKAGK